jgi:hypothetical protein
LGPSLSGITASLSFIQFLFVHLFCSTVFDTTAPPLPPSLPSSHPPTYNSTKAGLVISAMFSIRLVYLHCEHDNGCGPLKVMCILNILHPQSHILFPFYVLNVEMKVQSLINIKHLSIYFFLSQLKTYCLQCIVFFFFKLNRLSRDSNMLLQVGVVLRPRLLCIT